MRALALIAALAALSRGGAAGAQNEPLGSFIVCPGNPRCPAASAESPRVGPTRGFSLGRSRRARVGAVRSSPEPVAEEAQIFFDVDSAELSVAMRAELDASATTLAGSGGTLRIEGHADPSGPADYNVALAGRRAAAVRDYLLSRGVAAERMMLISWGSSQPIGAGADAQARQLSRRVEIHPAGPEDQVANPGSSR